MVEAIDDDKLRALGDDPAALYARRLIEQLSGEVKRQAQKNAALSLEVARLKRWRFGQSSESLDCHQGELFDAKTQALLQQEEQAEDRAADDERDSPSKRRPKRQPLLGQPVLHADETPVAELKPGAGKTHCPTCGCIAARASRWWSTTTAAVAPVSMRARSCVAGQERIGELYRIDQDIREIDPDERLRRRRQDTQPRLHALHAWLREQRSKLAKADATARAIHYALGRWTALGVFAGDPLVPIDNNAAERAVRPIALGRKNWLFLGSRQAGERAAALVTLIESAKLCGLDPWACLKDVFTRLPTWPNCQWLDLLPHHWTPPS